MDTISAVFVAVIACLIALVFYALGRHDELKRNIDWMDQLQAEHDTAIRRLNKTVDEAEQVYQAKAVLN